MLFNAARHCLDFDFVVRNPDYRQLVAYVNTDDHDWLNFEMKEAEQIDLFTDGALAAADFLRRFDWATNTKSCANSLSTNEPIQLKKARQINLPGLFMG